MKLQAFQRKLYLKAKREPTYRFYSLYDKVCRWDVLCHAYALVRANQGEPGVDGMTFEQIEPYGHWRFLLGLQADLKEGRYRPEAVRRVMIPKADGGERPLGIPTIRDRVVQAAAKLVLEPIFESDFTDNAYGYRPGRGANQAVRQVHGHLRCGYVHVVDADLSKYFDTIPHAQLLRSVARRVSDGQVLHLIKLWLRSPIERRDERGKCIRHASAGKGTPQGGLISPLLANIYMRRFLKAWEQRGLERRLQARIVNYADDFVILCRCHADRALAEAKRIIEAIGLTMNDRKTCICDVWKQPFDFLGYRFGVQYAFGSGRPYLGAYPSARSMNQMRDMLRLMTGPWTEHEEVNERVGAINDRLRGWMHYFNYGSLWRSYVKLDHFAQDRVRRWLVRKHKVGTRGERRFPADYIYDRLGLMNLPKLLGSKRTP